MSNVSAATTCEQILRGGSLFFFIFFYCMLIECKKENNIKEKSLHTTVYTYTKYVLPIILLYLM